MIESITNLNGETHSFIPCAFVNGNPVKYGKIVGYKVSNNNDQELTLFCLRNVFYKHPEAENECLLQVIEPEVICRAKPSDKHYSKLLVLYHSQEIVAKITTGE